MEKPADTQYQVHDLIRRRWSPRAFSSRPVGKDKLLSLLEAARWSQSSFNEQPWGIIVATREDPGEYQRLLDCLVPGNQRWAQTAPVLMLTLAKLRFDKNGAENRHAFHDVGLAAQNLSVQATATGLFVHMMAGFDVARARQSYGIPDSWEPVAALALGYMGNAGDLPEELRERERAKRTRKTLASFVFQGRFGRPAPLLEG